MVATYRYVMKNEFSMYTPNIDIFHANYIKNCKNGK
jgi:hypothetical protein